MELFNKNKIFFETEEDLEDFKKTQRCFFRKYYDTKIKCFYLIISIKSDWLGREIKPNYKKLDFSTIVFSNYCNIYENLRQFDLVYDLLSKQENNFNIMAKKKFLEHINNIRLRFDN